jgi:hypothetical protein
MKNNSLPGVLVILTFILISGNAAAQAENIIGGDMGIYRIHGNVDGAQVYFDGDYKGEVTEGILDVPVYVTGTPYRTYTVQEEGYKTYTGAISSVPAKGQVIDIYVKLSALPVVEYGTLHLLVTPTFSTVYLDDVEAGIVPPNGIFIMRNVVPGTHEIRISKEGYTPVTIEQYVDGNEIVKVPVTLEAPSAGSLSVSSIPPGAQVVLDGEVRGVTPLSIQNITEGEHTLILQMDGYSDYTETVMVTPEGAVVSATLIPVFTASGRIGLSTLSLLSALATTAFLIQKRS